MPGHRARSSAWGANSAAAGFIGRRRGLFAVSPAALLVGRAAATPATCENDGGPSWTTFEPWTQVPHTRSHSESTTGPRCTTEGAKPRPLACCHRRDRHCVPRRNHHPANLPRPRHAPHHRRQLPQTRRRQAATAAGPERSRHRRSRERLPRRRLVGRYRASLRCRPGDGRATAQTARREDASKAWPDPRPRMSASRARVAERTAARRTRRQGSS